MATIVIERGFKSFSCWNYLHSNGYKFESYRLFLENSESETGMLAFDIEDEKVAVECRLRFG